MVRYHLILGSEIKRKKEETSLYDAIPTTNHPCLEKLCLNHVDAFLGYANEEPSKLLLKPPLLYCRFPQVLARSGELNARPSHLCTMLLSVSLDPSPLFRSSYFACPQELLRLPLFHMLLIKSSYLQTNIISRTSSFFCLALLPPVTFCLSLILNLLRYIKQIIKDI